MSPDDQIRRRDTMIDAVESGPRGGRLAEVVAELYRQDGVELDVLLEDLFQIRALVADAAEEHVLDVMDMVIGLCRPEERIGPYDWGDPRNVFARRHKAGKPLAGPD